MTNDPSIAAIALDCYARLGCSIVWVAMRYQPSVRLLRLAWKLHGSHVGLTLEDMRAELGDGGKPASKSTAERSKRAIEAAFPQLEAVGDDTARSKRWRIPAGSLGAFAGFGGDDLASLDAAAALCRLQGMAAQADTLADLGLRLRALLGAAAARAETDVEVLSEAEGIAHRPGPRPRTDPKVIAALRHAIKALRRVRLTYQGRDSARLSRQTVSPLGILYGNRNYLLAYSHNAGFEGIRSYALTNVRGVAALDEPAHRPPEFTDLKSYTAHWFGVWEEPPVDVVLRFTKAVAADAREFLFHPSQSLHELARGRLEVRFRAGGLQEMAWHLMTWGDAVTVVKPSKLKALTK